MSVYVESRSKLTVRAIRTISLSPSAGPQKKVFHGSWWAEVSNSHFTSPILHSYDYVNHFSEGQCHATVSTLITSTRDDTSFQQVSSHPLQGCQGVLSLGSEDGTSLGNATCS